MIVVYLTVRYFERELALIIVYLIVRYFEKRNCPQNLRMFCVVLLKSVFFLTCCVFGFGKQQQRISHISDFIRLGGEEILLLSRLLVHYYGAKSGNSTDILDGMLLVIIQIKPPALPRTPYREVHFVTKSMFGYSQFFWPMTLNREWPWTLGQNESSGSISYTSVKTVHRESVQQLGTTQQNSFKQGQTRQSPYTDTQHGVCLTETWCRSVVDRSERRSNGRWHRHTDS